MVFRKRLQKDLEKYRAHPLACQLILRPKGTRSRAVASHIRQNRADMGHPVFVTDTERIMHTRAPHLCFSKDGAVKQGR